MEDHAAEALLQQRQEMCAAGWQHSLGRMALRKLQQQKQAGQAGRGRIQAESLRQGEGSSMEEECQKAKLWE